MKFVSFILTALLLFSTALHAHCQIPCGVYDDTMRVKMIEEHTLTILKSMNYIASNQNDLEKQNFKFVNWADVQTHLPKQ